MITLVCVCLNEFIQSSENYFHSLDSSSWFLQLSLSAKAIKAVIITYSRSLKENAAMFDSQESTKEQTKNGKENYLFMFGFTMENTKENKI